MIDLRKVHEQESFELRSEKKLSWHIVEPILMAMGFTLIDDFVSLKRKDKGEPWQSKTVASCNFLACGKEVYPDENDFDSMLFSVLVATLPERHITEALRVLDDIAKHLGLSVSYAGRSVSREECAALVKTWLSEIVAETGDVCGSESVRILIEMEYPKRRI